MCYHQNLTELEDGHDQGGLKDMYVEEMRESALCTQFGLVCPYICNLLDRILS
jgi:hypothetical protein